MPANRRPAQKKPSLGKSLINSRIPQVTSTHRNHSANPVTTSIIHENSQISNESQKPSLQSVVEEPTQLDTFIATTLSSQKEYQSLRGKARFLPDTSALHEPRISKSMPNTSLPSLTIPRRALLYKELNTSVDRTDSPSKIVHITPSITVPTPDDDNESNDEKRSTENDKNLLVKSRHTPSNHGVIGEEEDRQPKTLVQNRLTKSELDKIDMESFLKWRRDLSMLEDTEEYTLTPFEKNIEIWKQLWRVLERSHIILEILDARNPLLYHSADLFKYAKEIDPRKQVLIVINKSDFLSAHLREVWHDYFESLGLEVVFFSAITELFYQGALGPQHFVNLAYDTEEEFFKSLENTESENKLSKHRILDTNSFISLLESRRDSCYLEKKFDYTIGLVGFPNVGKSSMINSIFGSKKVSMSRQPGKTKHFQTLSMPNVNLTLCDCPGLVFPSVTVSKNHLLINGIISMNHFRGEFKQAIQIICDQIPQQLCKRYGVRPEDVCEVISSESSLLHINATKFLASLAQARKFYSGGKGGQFDLFKSASLIIQDYVSGKLLYNYHPFEASNQEFLNFSRDVICSKSNQENSFELSTSINSEAEVIKLLSQDQAIPQKITKRMMRKNEKKMLKGKNVQINPSSLYSFTT